MKSIKHYTEYLDQAREAEKDGDPEKAAVLYEKVIQQEPLTELPYQRLMGIYRKSREYQKELATIKKGLARFKAHYDEKSKPYTGKGKVAELSRQLLKSVSGNEKRTSYTLYPEPIPQWTLRMKAVEKKLGKK